MNPHLSRYAPLQALGEELGRKGSAGPVRRSRWWLALAGLLSAGAIALTPAGAAIGGAIDDLIGDEPTAPSLFFGDLPGDHKPSKVQRLYFDNLLRLSAVVGGGTTPAGTPFQMVVAEEASSPVFGSCALVAFDIESDASRDTETCVGPTVAGFRDASLPLYPTVYRGPLEQGEIPTPVIIGIAPADVASVRITYTDSQGERVEAPTTTAAVSEHLLAAKDDLSGIRDPIRQDRRPPFANSPYAFFVGFLPPELDQNGPHARQVKIDYEDIELTALGADGQQLSSMRMDGRFSGDPGLLSFG